MTYCPECGDIFEYELGTWLEALPYLRFCSITCFDAHMDDKIVIRGIVPEPRKEDARLVKVVVPVEMLEDSQPDIWGTILSYRRETL